MLNEKINQYSCFKMWLWPVSRLRNKACILCDILQDRLNAGQLDVTFLKMGHLNADYKYGQLDVKGTKIGFCT